MTTTVEPSTTIVAEMPRPHPVHRTKVRSRALEDESEEDPEEDEDQRVADRDNGRREQGDGRGEKQRAEGNGARRGARVVHLRAPRLRSPPRPILTGRSARVTACRPGPDGGP